LVLLLGKCKALLPLASLSEHLKSRHVTRFNNLAKLVVIYKHSFLLCVDLLHKHVLDFLWSDLAGALNSSVPLLALNESINSLFEEANRFVDVSSGLELLDFDKSLTNNGNNFLNSVLGIVHGHVETIVVNLLEVVWVAEVHLSDLKVSVDSLLVVS
jgi:hypothetical protein